MPSTQGLQVRPVTYTGSRPTPTVLPVYRYGMYGTPVGAWLVFIKHRWKPSIEYISVYVSFNVAMALRGWRIMK